MEFLSGIKKDGTGEQRGIKEDGAAYNCLFDPASGINESIKKGATLADTMKMLPSKVRDYKFQAQRIAAAMRNIDNKVGDTCYNIWKFLTDHIAYNPDQTGKEQVRSVRRLWSDRIGDCDCFSFFTSCVLSVLRIPHQFRIASYDEVSGSYGHVYVVVPSGGKEITIDAVLPYFNREHPYVKIKNIDMDLEFLDGIDPDEFARNGGMSIDAQDMLSCQLPSATDESVGKLNLFQNVKEKIQNVKEKVQTVKENVKTATQNIKENVKETVRKVGTVISKGVHVINRINPATTALRLGLLAGMKLNLFGVAGQLRYGYLTDAEAQKRGVNPKRFERYKKLRAKLEKIFFNAGGKPENLKEAILTGKGNQDNKVTLSGYALSGLGMTGNNTVEQIIGSQMYSDEIPEEKSAELHGLGIVETAAVTAVASGLLATIAGILKNIGDLFGKGEPGSDAGMDALDQQAGDSAPDETAPSGEDQGDYSTERNEDEPSADSSDGDQSGGDPAPDSEASFFDKAKDWMVKNKKPLIIGTVTVAAVVGGVIVYKKFFAKKKGKGNGGSRAETTNGIPKAARGQINDQSKKSKGNKGDKILRDLRLSRLK